MKLVLIGIQGSGKSTQGNLLSKQLKIPYLSTGHIFRNIATERSAIGKKVKLLMSAGHLIPDDLTIETVKSYLSRPEYQSGYILDGFPRTLQQAKAFDSKVDHVLHIAIPDREALWRLAYRNEQRDDDTIDAIKKRIETFKTTTLPVLKFYDDKKILHTIDGTMDVEEVNNSILSCIGKQMVSNKLKKTEQNKATIISIVGMPGSGKTEVSEYLKKKGLSVVSFSSIVNDMIDEQGLTHDNETHKRLRMQIRKEHGMEGFAKLSAPKINDLLKNGTTRIVIEGMRSWEEYLYIKKNYSKIRIVIFAIHADKKIRYQRIQARETRSMVFGEERDIDELISLNMGPTIVFSDYLITNNKSKEELIYKVDEVIQDIYFT